MELQIENIGMIRKATVDIGGLAVIAGENDTGKSTVGKTVYSLVRSYNPSSEEFEEWRSEKMRDLLRSQLRKQDKNKDRSANSMAARRTLELEFLQFDQKQYLFDEENPSSTLQAFWTAAPESWRDQWNKLKGLEQEPSNDGFRQEYLAKDRLPYLLRHEFGDSPIATIGAEGSSRIELVDQKGSITAVFSQQDLPQLTVNYQALPILCNALYIGTPFQIDGRTDPWRRSPHLGKSAHLQQHFTESVWQPDMESQTELLEKISRIICGKLGKQGRQLRYQKESYAPGFALEATATGVKSLGLLQLLIANGHLNSQTLLIMDEPEVHLHPDWQVVIAEVLTILAVKHDVPVLICSHSPYLIEALRTFARKYQHQQHTRFYHARLAEEQNFAIIEDATKDILPIIESLTRAYDTMQKINFKI